MSMTTTPSVRLQVLQIVGNAIVGGMETCVQRLVERLPPERFGVTVLCPYEGSFSDRLRTLGAEVVITPMPENPPWCSIQLACSLIKAQGIDVIQAHMDNAHLLAGLAGKMMGKPVIGTVHGRQVATVDVEMHRLAGTHLNVVCQQAYFHALGLGVNPAQLHLIPNGVDVNVFKPRHRRDGALRQRFSVPLDAPLVGFVGRLAPEKGPGDFLRAALIVHQARPDVRFIIAGEGPMLPQLQAFIAQYQLGDVVHLAGLQTDMPAVYAELDVLASTSISEAMPLALMEAMASGLPIVATNVGGVPELVQQGVTGWLASGGDFELIGLYLLNLLGDPALLNRMGERARLRAVERFSIDQGIESTMRLYTRLAQPRTEQRRIGAVSDPKLVLNGTSARNVAKAARA
ncbi:MAG: glycosyltransferase [Rubrivivax sp.]|nr:MAG: glycosyltransferase [Rubrivivax sp.]